MDNSHTESWQKTTFSENNEIYMQIWQGEQQNTRNRWTVTTFFMSVSFAILGFSFQSTLPLPTPSIIRTIGLLIYWFAFILFWHLNRYNKFLRKYLVEMEKSNATTLDLQSKALASPAASEKVSTTRLLLYFGLIYAIGVISLWFLSF